MRACVDVDYRTSEAIAACVCFAQWADAAPVQEATTRISPIAPYEPGSFYRRELPCLLQVIAPLVERLSVILVDGYVWLQNEETPGLGAHLWQALARRIPVIGVAKTRFASAGAARPVVRGSSRAPLYVTAAGMTLDEACAHLQSMHGPYRIPTLLKRVDHLCRTTGRATEGEAVCGPDSVATSPA